eukprot:1963713-Pyramimonas_sp.AAC.2
MKYCEAVPQLLAHAGDNAVGAIFAMEEEEDVEIFNQGLNLNTSPLEKLRGTWAAVPLNMGGTAWGSMGPAMYDLQPNGQTHAAFARSANALRKYPLLSQAC